MKSYLKSIPLIGPALRYCYRTFLKPQPEFRGSQSYWDERYNVGGNSGDGSYRQLAKFKAEILNQFVRDENIQSVIEYGSGDGNQLSLASYPSYLGFDVSKKAVDACKEKFAKDHAKSFKEVRDYADETADLTLSLDVVYHLVEDNVFVEYMNRLFDSSNRFVIVYASNTDENPPDRVPHVRHRKFTSWVEQAKPGWKLVKLIPNKYPYRGDTRTGSFADFFVFQKR